MEDKQLDFNAPLLSVRRFSSDGYNSNKIENSQGNKPYVPPYYKSELKSGPMRHAGTVPFVWEQIPGKRKDGDEGSPDRSIERLPVAPKLPPGRILEVKPQSLDKEFKERTIVRPQSDSGRVSHEKVLLTVDAPKMGSTQEGKKGKSEADSEDGDEVYADALDSLSRSESLLFNCSVSGISGMDGMSFNRSETSSTDPQTRDYMMGRFLPAAKAMASETPQHTSWRQPATRELPMIAKKTANGDKRPPLYQYKSYIAPQYVEETVEEESEDDDDDYGDNTNSPAKACGLFPKFCLRNSLFLMNPVPGMKVRSRAPYSSARKLSTHLKTTYSVSNGETDDMSNWEAVYKHKLLSDLRPLDDESKGTSESNQLTYWSDSQTPDGSSPHMHSGGGGISPFRSETIQSPFHEGIGFLGIPKQVKSVRANKSVSHEDSKWGSGSLSPLVEKTLHVDSEYLQTETSNVSYSDTHQMIVWKEDSEILNGCQGIDSSSLAVSCPRDIKNLATSQENGMLKPKISEVVGSNLWNSSERSNPLDTLDGTRGRGLTKTDVLDPGSRSLMPPEFSTSGFLEFDKVESWKEEDKGNSNDYSLQHPLPPPLPKSPSESWLWRTLPSVSSKNGASFRPRKESPKRASINPKWETIVKTSNVHHSHLRFSEELTKPVPQQSET